MQYERFFSKPPEFSIATISPVKELQYFIAEYPNAELMDSLFELQKNYSYYRAIAGDGNCYYRAIIFQYLRVADLSNKDHLFPRVDLFKCRGLPFNERGGITSDGIMDYIYTNYLWPLENLGTKDRQKRLEEHLNRSKHLDAALIAYFRVRNHSYLASQRAQYQSFSDAGIDQDLERILTYGQESEGIELYTLSMVLEARVTIVVVHQQNYTQYDLNSQRYRHNFIVSYRPGHYDIPIPPSEVDQRSFTPMYSQTPQPPAKGYASTILNRISQQRPSRGSGPKKIQINKANDIKLLRRVSEGNKSNQRVLDEPKNWKNGPPQNMKEFRQRESISRSSLKIEKRDSQPEKITGSQPKELSESRTTKLPRNSLVLQKEKREKNQKLFEGAVCIFFIFVAGAGLFMI